jgi:hypothetical protein
MEAFLHHHNPQHHGLTVRLPTSRRSVNYVVVDVDKLIGKHSMRLVLALHFMMSGLT